MKTLLSFAHQPRFNQILNHESFGNQDQVPVNGFELLERISQMQLNTGKELNNYDSVLQIHNLDQKLGLPELIAQKHSPESFYKSGWSQVYEQQFGNLETGKFFRQPEQVLRNESLYSIPARQYAIDTQFRITKEALDKRQKDNELLYLGTEEQKALQNIVEKQLTKEAGGFIQVAEMWRTMFSTEKGQNRRRNERLSKKIAEEMNLPLEKSTAIVEAMTGHMTQNTDQIIQIETTAAAQAGMTIEDFRKTNRGKKLLADLVHFLTVGGFVAAGIATGGLAPIAAVAAVPLLGVNFKGRIPIGLNGDTITNQLRDGRNLTETIEHTARELDNTLHMTQNLINSSEILARGRNVRYLRGVDQRYDNLKQMIDHQQMQFNISSLGDQSLESKTMYETLGFVVDQQGLIQLKEAERFKRMLYGRLETGDRADKKEYKASLRVLEDTLPDNASLSDVIALNQKKVLELQNIVALAESEIAEEALKRRNQKNPARLENKRSMLRQLSRFAKTQNYFVNDQKTFYLLKELGNKPNHAPEQKKQALYEAAVITLLGSFDSADQIMKQFGSRMSFMHPDGRNFTPNWDYLHTTLEKYYRSANPKTVLGEILCNTDFETWFMSIGSFTNLYGSHKTLPSMERFSCEAHAIDQRKACDYKDYNFDNDFVVSPKGTKFYMPLGIPLGMLEQGGVQVGVEAIKNSTATVEAGLQLPPEVIAAMNAANAPQPFMAGFWAPTGVPASYAPNIAGSVAGGLASTTIQHRKKPHA